MAITNDIPFEALLTLQGKRGAIYARVSTDKQEDNGYSLDLQVENCEELARKASIEVVVTFREVYSGSVYRERKKLTKLRQMARNDEIDVVLINTYDRLSRNQTHMAVLIDEIEHMGIQILCVKEDFDKTSTGQFMRAAMAFVAEVEREKIAQRTEAGRKRRVEEGKLNPGSKPRYGYRWANHKKERCVTHEEESQVVRRIHHMYAYERKSAKGIANILTAEGILTPRGKQGWFDSTVRSILRDPIYIGKATSFKWDTRTSTPGTYSMKLRPLEEQMPLPEGTVPAIVDEETFNLVQERMKLNAIDSPRNNKTPGESLLRCGFIKCGYCGRTLAVGRSATNSRRKNPEILNEYRCSWKFRGSRRCKEAPTISLQRIDSAVWAYIGELIQDFSMVEKAIELAKKCNSHLDNLQGIENSIKLATATQDQLYADLKQVGGDGLPKLKGRARELILDDLQKSQDYLDKLEDERRKILAGEKQWKEMQEDIDKFVAWCLTARETYPHATYEEKRRAIRMLGIQAIVWREDDASHERYEIRVGFPDIVRHRS